jgi:hypothetical protein
MIDTANKRASALSALSWFVLAGPFPTGTVDAGDRVQMAHEYRGLFDGVVVVPGDDWIATLEARQRALTVEVQYRVLLVHARARSLILVAQPAPEAVVMPERELTVIGRGR